MQDPVDDQPAANNDYSDGKNVHYAILSFTKLKQLSEIGSAKLPVSHPYSIVFGDIRKGTRVSNPLNLQTLQP